MLSSTVGAMDPFLSFFFHNSKQLWLLLSSTVAGPSLFSFPLHSLLSSLDVAVVDGRYRPLIFKTLLKVIFKNLLLLSHCLAILSFIIYRV